MNNEQNQDLRERWRKLRTDAVSEMFETGPDKYGIFSTTALYEKLDAAFDLLASGVSEPLRQQVKDLQRWKSEQLEVETSWNEQAVGRELGMKPGTVIRPNILPEIVKLKERIAELEGAFDSSRVKILIDGLNQIANWVEFDDEEFDDVRDCAKTTLSKFKNSK